MIKEQTAIIDEIMTERQRQMDLYTSKHDDSHSPIDWIAILICHLGAACADEARIDADRFRKQMTRVAAVALAAIESFDRTHPPRGIAGPNTGIGKGY